MAVTGASVVICLERGKRCARQHASPAAFRKNRGPEGPLGQGPAAGLLGQRKARLPAARGARTGVDAGIPLRCGWRLVARSSQLVTLAANEFALLIVVLSFSTTWFELPSGREHPCLDSSGVIRPLCCCRQRGGCNEDFMMSIGRGEKTLLVSSLPLVPGWAPRTRT